MMPCPSQEDSPMTGICGEKGPYDPGCAGPEWVTESLSWEGEGCLEGSGFKYPRHSFFFFLKLGCGRFLWIDFFFFHLLYDLRTISRYFKCFGFFLKNNFHQLLLVKGFIELLMLSWWKLISQHHLFYTPVSHLIFLSINVFLPAMLDASL